MVAYTLYHYSLCPFCRKIRFILNDFGISYKTKECKFWKYGVELVKLNPALEVPVLVNEKENITLVDSFVIAEYLEEKERKKDDLLKLSHLSDNELEKAEIRRLEMWFDKKFYNEVSKYILEEKVYHSFYDEKFDINTKRLKAGEKNLEFHLKYIEFLLNKRNWLAGENFSLADISASTQISSLDYLGEIPWSKFPLLKTWYLTIKSKLAFQTILKDKIEGFIPSKYYCEFDFD